MAADSRSPERGQYAFVQALIREVAYSTFARADRRNRHLAAARFFESLEEEELAGAVATHYLDAFRLSAEGPDAEEIAEKARRSLVAAADRAAALGAHDQAITYLELVMSITTEPSDRAELLDDAAMEANAAGQYAAAEQPEWSSYLPGNLEGGAPEHFNSVVSALAALSAARSSSPTLAA